jgi:phospholipid transport system transporter-binding protein
MLVLPPVLTHEVAAGFAKGLKLAVQSQPAAVVADAGQLREFDSSALAVLLECRREAMSAGKTFAVQGLPTRLRKLASLYGVEALVPAAV